MTRDEVKARAKRLRAELAGRGQAISHGQALDLVARTLGARDWNTLSARLPRGPMPGARVAGRYLGRRFTGRVLSSEPLAGDALRLKIFFDHPVDSVRWSSFSNLRRRVTADIGPSGSSPAVTANGQPHLVLTRFR